jgi:hypothetical protein
MADFLVTAEDCGLTENKPADSEMLALTRFVAMGAVHGQQQREMAQQQRHSRHLAAFSAPNTDTRNIRRRQGYDQLGSYGPITGSSSNEKADDTSAGTYFGATGASSYEPYIPLDDDDASMHAPEEPNQTTCSLHFC